MKFNWGHGIAVFFTAFVAFMIIMVLQSTQKDVELVRPDYYDQEVKYQQQIDKEQNVKGLESPVSVAWQDGELHLQFPPSIAQAGAKGEILLFRPSDAQLDTRLALKLDTAGRQVLNISGAKSGMWRVQIDWESNGKGYFVEEVMTIP